MTGRMVTRSPQRLRLHGEAGFSFVEVVVASALTLAILGVVLGLLTVGTKTERFTQAQGVSLDEARLSMQKLSRDFQSASAIGPCSPGASLDTCTVVVTQTPSGNTDTVKYEVDAGELKRSIQDPVTLNFVHPEVLSEGVVNGGGEPVFTCQTQSTYPRVEIDLQVQSAASSGESLNLKTTARPRNVSGQSTCP